MGEVMTKEAIKSPLKNKTILVRPIYRNGGFLKKGHDGHFLYTGATYEVCIPYSNSQRQYVDPLTDEERKYFESPEGGLALSPGDLSIYKKKNNFWEQLSVILDKTSLTLDLSNPMDYLRYKLLLTDSVHIAPTLADKDRKYSYKYVLVDTDDEEQVKANQAYTRNEAYKQFGKIEDSFDKMLSVCQIYSNTKSLPGNKKVSKRTSKDALVAIIDEIISEDMNLFLDIVTDPNFSIAAEIEKGLDSKIIEKDSDNNFTFEGDVIGRNKQDLIGFFSNVKNQKKYITLKNKLDVTE